MIVEQKQKSFPALMIQRAVPDSFDTIIGLDPILGVYFLDDEKGPGPASSLELKRLVPVFIKIEEHIKPNPLKNQF